MFESENEALRSKSSENETTTEVTFSQSFSATGGEDTVVLSTVAYDAYAYTAYYPGVNGTLEESPYIIYVPRGGADSVKTASLTYEDYLTFIPYANGVLPDLKDVFTHTVGKPETYPHIAPSGVNVEAGSIITHPRLSTFPSNTGSQTLTIDITEETSQTTSAGSSISAKLGGVRSNPFTVKVTEYQTPVWIEADKSEIDFGSMRFDYSKGTPSAKTQYVTVKSLHSELQEDFTATLEENSDFEIVEPLSSSTLYAKDLANSTATVSIAPKKGLAVGTHTGTLTITNGITAAYVTLSYTVDSLENGEIQIPISTSGAYAKVFLLDSVSNMHPLCEELRIPLS